MEVEVNNTVEFSNTDIKPSIFCKYCLNPENKQDNPGLRCENCNSFVHLTCLRRPGTPGDFACDVFFEFVCAECSGNNEEVFERKRFQWVNVLLLTLHHLSIQSYGISNNGFFHYKTHICSFIDRNWVLLFGTHFKQKKSWVGTIAGALSVYNNTFFMSGSVALGETGWWRLLHSFSPAVAAHINLELSKEKIKGRPRNYLNVDKRLFFTKAAELGYKDLIKDIGDQPPCKKMRLDSECEPSTSQEFAYDVDREEVVEDVTTEGQDICLNSEDALYLGYPYDTVRPQISQSDTSSIHSLQQSGHNYDSDSRSSPQHLEPPTSDDYEDRTRPELKKPPNEKTKKQEEAPILRRESLFSTQLNSIDMPWLEPDPPPAPDLVEVSEYEEIQLLKRVENLIPKVKDSNKKAHLHRFRAKLALRRLKRHKHLPIFDLDKTARLLRGYIADDPKVLMNAERILDRFQRSYLLDNLSGTVASQQRGAALVSRWEAAPFRSAYSGTLLRPYIRRDTSARPLWLRLTDELLTRTHRGEVGYVPRAPASLDYCYVRPQHIAPVNALLAQFFWPGIDMTEALQHPEFSCVVTYRRLVVGCAFLVPDAGHNEAYISFILTRPEWRNAKIATFMLYHLLQTCTGKDVTLHVSPTNPAIFLYQKFGFKVEELIQDFYEKYYDIDYKGCRHALFLRLVR
ncbi:PREDICTED: cysteine-rich protein 2-binding protein isoform X1 [Papilio xuthus]|uniref:Cysteine-rich protein 2-binding protein isoform X1 n=1 Tax=Papilio xuthus TaxID=66420 RepID=A0AAJ7EH50_PAPXU|nr:PREDICTED: cysteine-rich protein 2-binding protein isoform X1 [Papilio xuthus]